MINLCDLQQLSVGAGLANGEEEETAGLEVATAEGRGGWPGLYMLSSRASWLLVSKSTSAPYKSLVSSPTTAWI